MPERSAESENRYKVRHKANDKEESDIWDYSGKRRTRNRRSRNSRRRKRRRRYIFREQVKHPAQLAFEKNLKFLNQKTYPEAFFQSLFTGR